MNDYDAVYLYDNIIRCLLYADDLVLFSRSAAGLQHQLNVLHEYCKIWSLTVNVSKTECMYVHSKNKKNKNKIEIKPPPLFFDEIQISYVEKFFKYVGVLFFNDGTFQNNEESIINKSTRAIYICKASDPCFLLQTILSPF